MRVGMNCSHIDVCCGPCADKVPEGNHPYLKPYSGGRYEKFTWKTERGVYVDLYSVRMCRTCCHRYMEIMDGVDDHDFECMEMMHRDAEAVLTYFEMQHMLCE